MFSSFTVVSQKYLDKYIALVSKEDTCEYVEVHHKLPRCMGGLDDENNLVKLSARKHFLAHFMLWKAFRTSQLAGAFLMMTVSTKSMHRESKINSRLYEKLKEIDKAASSARTSNLVWVSKDGEEKYIPSERVNDYLDIGWKRGRAHSLNNGKVTIEQNGVRHQINKDDFKKYSVDGWVIVSSNNNKISVIKDNKMKYIELSELDFYLSKGWHRGAANKGLKVINNGLIIKRVSDSELPEYLNSGWVLGFIKKPAGRIYITDGVLSKQIYPADLDIWISKGFKRGRTLKKKGD